MDPKLARAVSEVFHVARPLGLDPVLIGALSSDVAPGRPPGLPPPRLTQDADLAVLPGSWDAYERLMEALLKAGFRRDPHIEHRVHAGNVTVDLLPYGKGISPDGRNLIWPRSEFTMDVTGFEEVCAAAQPVLIEGGLTLRTITLPGFALLKCCAFLDRQAKGDPKHEDDAADLAFWFRQYASGPDEARRYEVVGSADPSIEYLDSGAAVLGIDVAALASDAATDRLERFLEAAAHPHGPFVRALVRRALSEEAWERQAREVLALVAAFSWGFRKGRAKSGTTNA